MNSDKLKHYVTVRLNEAADKLGGMERVREMHQSINMNQFLSGWICGVTTSFLPATRVVWEDDWRDPKHPPTMLTQEEIRRISDYVRLLIETGSTGS